MRSGWDQVEVRILVYGIFFIIEFLGVVLWYSNIKRFIRRRRMGVMMMIDFIDPTAVRIDRCNTSDPHFHSRMYPPLTSVYLRSWSIGGGIDIRSPHACCLHLQ